MLLHLIQKSFRPAALLAAALVIALSARGDAPLTSRDNSSPSVTVPAQPKQIGGEPDGIVQVANLIYAGTKSSKCFSDNSLVQAEKDSTISTSRRFHAVKLGSDELFEFPMVIMTGEGDFDLTDGERQNLRRFIERGGFLLASAGCSSPEWDRSFRAEMARVFPEFPNLKFILPHTGGTSLFLRGRISMFFEPAGVPNPTPGLAKTQRGQRELGRDKVFEDLWGKFYFDTAGNGGWAPVIQWAADTVTPARVMFGSDYPLESYSGETVRERFAKNGFHRFHRAGQWRMPQRQCHASKCNGASRDE